MIELDKSIDAGCYNPDCSYRFGVTKYIEALEELDDLCCEIMTRFQTKSADPLASQALREFRKKYESLY